MMIEQEHLAPGWCSVDQVEIDPAELWLDQDISPEELIQLDPLDITLQMVEQAESPELGDRVLRKLPQRELTLAQEALWRKAMKAELRRRHAVWVQVSLDLWLGV